MRIETLLSPAAIEAVMRPIGKASGLPSAAYTDPQFLALEEKLLFAPSWIYAGRAAELAHPGDIRPVKVAGQPLLLLRNRSGEIKAFHNVCSHRNALLLREPVSGRPTLTCPYHAWSYDLDGRLVRTPHVGGQDIDDCPELDKETLGLKPVRLDFWAGLLFVNLTGDAPALADWLRPLTERWADYDFSVLRYGGGRSYELDTNWKHAIENYLESYHLPWVHKGLNSYSRMSDHYTFFAGSDAAGQGTTVYAPGSLRGLSLPGQSLPAELAARAEYPVLFPNLMTGLQSDHFYLIEVLPDGPERARERFEIFFFGEEAMTEELEAIRAETIERWDAVFVEDIDVVERLQQGHASAAATGGRFSPAQDQAVHHFQRRLLERMLVRQKAAAAAE
ncbi:MAG TPA: aromatic ring-hydroxylating dioxygenase subunit alpha [Dongiaceae bacterium]